MQMAKANGGKTPESEVRCALERVKGIEPSCKLGKLLLYH